jgi:hypothetical protein
MYSVCTTYRDDSIMLLRCDVCGISPRRTRRSKGMKLESVVMTEEYVIETTLLSDYTSPLRKTRVRRKSRI